MSENERGNGAPPTEAPAEAGAPAEKPAEIKAEETVEQKLARAEEERRNTHERLLRLAAEFENFKKRSRREADEAQARGREQLAKELLPVLDNFERALAALAAGGTVDQLGQGVKLVDRQLHTTLEKFDIKPFEALGEPFDPARHEAIQQMETREVPPGAVAKVFARGYMIGGRLLRPAMVAVAKAPADHAAGGNGSGAPADGDGEGGAA